MTSSCGLIHQPPQPTLSVRERTSIDALPAFLGRAYGEILAYLTELDEEPYGMPYAAYHSRDVTDLDVEAGMPVSRALPGRGEVKAGQISGGQAASCIYTGPYDGLAEGYESLAAWVEEQGLVASGIAYEVYLDDPGDTPEHELRTRIVFPVE